MGICKVGKAKGSVASVLVAVSLALMTVSCSGNKQGPADVKISFRMEPTHPRANQDVQFHARISGIPRDEMERAKVDFAYFKFVDYKPEGMLTDVVAQRTDSGEYVATARFDTATEWKVTVRVRRPGVDPITSTFPVTISPEKK